MSITFPILWAVFAGITALYGSFIFYAHLCNVNDINQNVQPTFDSVNTPTDAVVNNEFNAASEPVMSEPVMSVNQFETVQPSAFTFAPLIRS